MKEIKEKRERGLFSMWIVMCIAMLDRLRELCNVMHDRLKGDRYRIDRSGSGL